METEVSKRRKLKVYVATGFGHRDSIRERFKTDLPSVELTSRWLTSTHSGLDELSNDEKKLWASRDIQDVINADILVYDGSKIGLGKHVELGVALAHNHPVVLIGERQSIFHHHSRICKVFSSWDEFFKSDTKSWTGEN